jgi:hypothetical protein
MWQQYVSYLKKSSYLIEKYMEIHDFFQNKTEEGLYMNLDEIRLHILIILERKCYMRHYIFLSFYMIGVLNNKLFLKNQQRKK